MQFLGLIVLLVGLQLGNGIYRTNLYSYSRNIVPRDTEAPSKEYDTITLFNQQRGIMRGSVNDDLAFFSHDVIAAYIGPAAPHDKPPTHLHKPSESEYIISVRAWAMYDERSGLMCDLNAVQDWGEVALFTCPATGLYRVYAIEFNTTENVLDPSLSESKVPDKPTLSWTTKVQKDVFDLLVADQVSNLRKMYGEDANGTLTVANRMKKLKERKDKVVSDPVVVKSSYFCYYWMFDIRETARVGYLGNEVIPPSPKLNETAYILLELRMWIAEPSSLFPQEIEDHLGILVISEYSRVITNRFHDTGLFPCLRKMHSCIEIVSEIAYVSEIDQNNPLNGAPHWLANLKVHTDRLVSTLSDVTFTIASRQNTGSFHCFVGESQAYISIREFVFLPQAKLERGSINLEISNIWYKSKITTQHQMKHVYGHGVQYIGNKYTKIYQPSTTRTDMTVVNNACLAQEFAIVVGGTLYIAVGFIRKGISQVNKVIIPDFSAEHGIETDVSHYRNYLRVADVVFTPTHVVILMADGSVILHPTTPSLKGLGRIKTAHKYRPTAFVKRRWCPRTSTPKFSGMMVPMFSRSGNIIILQLNSVEGSVRMWLTPHSTSCALEGVGIVGKAQDQAGVINETDIHYADFAAVKRTNQKTGLEEPPPPSRPLPPPPPHVDLESEPAYLLNNDVILADGRDPHFPKDLLDPARHLIGANLEDFNEAVIYVLENEKKGIQKLLMQNGITNVASASEGDELGLYSVEFAAIEKQFITAIKFKAQEIPADFGANGKQPFQMMVTTVTVTNFPFRVKLQKDHRAQDEVLDTVIPFPGTIIVRSKPFKLRKAISADPLEEQEHTTHLQGETEVEFLPELFLLETAIPSYVINFGDIMVYTSLESRYCRPLHYYTWDVIDAKASKQKEAFKDVKPEALQFNESTVLFRKARRLHDATVTDQGIISVLWRKEKRYTPKEVEPMGNGTERGSDEEDDTGYTQTVAIGSVISLEGLREVKPFFRYDNIFQRVTPFGEIVYGIYEVKPHSPYEHCKGSWNATAEDAEPCIHQVEKEETAEGEQARAHIPFCSKSIPSPCISPAALQPCAGPASNVSCLRLNRLKCNNTDDCWPRYAPKEELRSVDNLSAPFQSYLLGSLQAVKSHHPEAPHPKDTEVDDEEELETDPYEEPDICPFSSFKLYNIDSDYAEVGFKTRVTGEISYFGIGIPTEADLIVEFDNVIGVIVEVSSFVEEQRGLTTIRKTIDISFTMTDYLLGEISEEDQSLENDLHAGRLDFDDVRAREKSQVFSVTVRPSIVNNHCKSTDYFKTVEFNVGCNTFSTIRLIDQAAPFSRINWKEVEEKWETDFKWHPNGDSLLIPKAHVYYRQVREGVFDCEHNKGKQCKIPYYDLFGNDIFTISYRDFFFPKFEQFLTVSTRPVTGNMVLYDLMGSDEFNLTTNNLQAGCQSTGDFWYEKLLNSTQYIGKGASEHEPIYMYFVDCYDTKYLKVREQSHQLSATSFHLHNLTNNNRIKFRRHRNQIFLFRAVVVNTEYNRFTYCRTLETYFLVRVTGIPIPRQGLALWNYLIIMFFVVVGLVFSYLIFFHFYTWKLDSIVVAAAPPPEEPTEQEKKSDD